jgi:hypothetical protein
MVPQAVFALSGFSGNQDNQRGIFAQPNMRSFEADQLLGPEDSSLSLDTAAGPWGQQLVFGHSCWSLGTAAAPWAQLLVPGTAAGLW